MIAMEEDDGGWKRKEVERRRSANAELSCAGLSAPHGFLQFFAAAQNVN
jgi:hypothetical protein